MTRAFITRILLPVLACAVFAIPTTTHADSGCAGLDDIYVPSENTCVNQTTGALSEPIVAASSTSSPSTTSDTSKKDVACSVFSLREGLDVNCLFISIASLIASLLLSLGAFFITVAGWLFDTLVRYAIIDFSGTLQTLKLTGVIESGWTIFRDVANIVIIGMFTFIAIATILGLENYGYQRMLARVLIVAILINFSLLFTRIAIDASNFTAYQFYRASASTDTNFDIAAAFMKPMGISGIFTGTFAAPKAAGDSVAGPGGAFAALGYGIVGMLMLMIASIVLLYGSFLILSRMLALIFIMLMSSIAFASNLTGSTARASFGWTRWWESLVNAVIFAPMLMVLLYISLKVLDASAGAAVNGSLGNVISGLVDKGKGVAMAKDAGLSFINYVLGIGMLIASFKVSSSIASQAGGVVAATTGTLGDAVGRFGGVLGRNTLGRMGVSHLEKLEEQREAARKRGDSKEAQRLNMQIDRSKRFGYGALAGKSYSVGSVRGSLLPGNASTESLAKQINDRAQRAAAVAQGGIIKAANISTEAKQGAYNQASEAAQKEREEQRKTLTEQRDLLASQAQASRAAADSMKKELEEQRAGIESELKNAMAEREAIDKRHYEGEGGIGGIRGVSEELAKETNSNRSAQLRDKLEGMRALRESEMRAQDAKIKDVRDRVTSGGSLIDKKIAEASEQTAAEKELAKIDADLKKFDSETAGIVDSQANKAVGAFVTNVTESSKLEAARAAGRNTSILSMLTGISTQTGRAAEKLALKQAGVNDNVQNLMKTLNEMGDQTRKNV